MNEKKQYDVAAYVWPAYTGQEPRTRIFWPEGDGEWQTVRRAAPKENGYNWGREPLWGCQDEADPRVMEQQIDAAVSHGVNVFAYDWYWYDGRPFLEQCLNQGFLGAANRHNMKFYLMWANHDAQYTWDVRNSHDTDTVLWRGSVDRREFEKLCRRLIERYFTRPEYYTIDGKPLFAIYDLANLIKGLGGGLEETRDALRWLRRACAEAGLPGVHLQIILQNPAAGNRSGVDGGACLLTPETARFLEVDSVTHYQYVHFTDIDRGYPELLPDVAAEWAALDRDFPVPYFPHVSLGWDNNPRFLGYREGVMKDTTPENIQKALEMAKAYADAHPDQPPLVTVNSWNEWTETSYLLPDNVNGYGYLEVVRKVFL